MAVLFGTRPEAIKLAPVILALRDRGANPLVVTTGQHRELVDDVLGRFEIAVDEDLNLMRPGQSLDYVLTRAVEGIGEVLDRRGPAAVVVQGDTTSTLGASLAAFHRRLPVAHVEAGLRSHDLELPYPEEMNRRVTSVIARWHFAPTRQAAENLRAEKIIDNVHITGNTVVDALRRFAQEALPRPREVEAFLGGEPYILATAHRRESWGRPISEVAEALSEVLEAEPTAKLVFATHPNRAARDPVAAILGKHPRAMLLDPISYPEFLGLLRDTTLAVTDSGGVQEEGPTMGIPVLVTRTVTERPEGVSAGAVRLVGTDRDRVRECILSVLRDDALRSQMANAGRNVYGDGRAADRIAQTLLAEAPS